MNRNLHLNPVVGTPLPTTGTDRLVVTSPVGGSREQISSHWDKHQAVEAHIKSGLPVTTDLINKTLFKHPVVTVDHIALCDEIKSKSVTIPLPVPGTSSGGSIPVIGLANASSALKQDAQVPGGYHIQSSAGNYVGQAVHLGSRAREHGGSDTNTSVWLLGDVAASATMELYLLPVGMDTLGLTRREFLCVLELYLFVLHRPTRNLTYVPTPGFMHTEASNLAQSVEKGTPLHAYAVNADGSHTLLYTSHGLRQMGTEVLNGAGRIDSIIARGGWYREEVLFSSAALVDDITDTITLEAFRAHLRQLEVKKTRYNQPGGYHGNPTSGNHEVIVEDVVANTTDRHKSKTKASEVLRCTRKSLNGPAKTGELFRNRYRITFVKASPTPPK